MKSFKIGLDNIIYKVNFKYHNNLIVECFVYSDFFNKVFRAKSKCNIKEGDIYNKKVGENLAFRKAWNKIEKRYLKSIKQLVNFEEILHSNYSTHYDKCLLKLEKIRNKDLKKKNNVM